MKTSFRTQHFDLPNDPEWAESWRITRSWALSWPAPCTGKVHLPISSDRLCGNPAPQVVERLPVYKYISPGWLLRSGGWDCKESSCREVHLHAMMRSLNI